MVSPGKHTFFALGGVIRTSRVRCTTTSQGVEKVVICQISLHGFLRCHMGVSLNCGPSTAWGNPTESYNVGGFKGPQFEATPMIMEMNIAISCPCIDSFLTEWYQSRVFTFAARWFPRENLVLSSFIDDFPIKIEVVFPATKAISCCFLEKSRFFQALDRLTGGATSPLRFLVHLRHGMVSRENHEKMAGFFSWEIWWIIPIWNGTCCSWKMLILTLEITQQIFNDSKIGSLWLGKSSN